MQKSSPRRVAGLTLVPYGEDENCVLFRLMAIQGEVTGLAAGNHQLSQAMFDWPADQRMISENLHRFRDEVDGFERHRRRFRFE